MSLDFTILQQDGTPGETVAFSVDAHWRLVQLAREQQLDAICIFQDYYEEIEAAAESLPEIARQLSLIKLNDESQLLLGNKIPRLCKLIEIAIVEHKSIFALPD